MDVLRVVKDGGGGKVRLVYCGVGCAFGRGICFWGGGYTV